MAQGEFTVSVDVDIKAAAKKLKNYQRRKLPNIVQQSLNRAGAGMRTEAKRFIPKEHVAMKSSQVFKLTYVKKAQRHNGIVYLVFKRDRVHSIASFKITRKPGKIISGKKRLSGTGLNARVWEKKKNYRGAFLWTRPSAKGGEAVTAFKRVSGVSKAAPTKRTGGDGQIRRIKRGPRKGQKIKRQPIEIVFGASLAQEVLRNSRKSGKGIRDKLLDIGRKRFLKEFNLRLSKLE